MPILYQIHKTYPPLTTNTAKTNRQQKQQTSTTETEIGTLVGTLLENDNNNRIKA